MLGSVSSAFSKYSYTQTNAYLSLFASANNGQKTAPSALMGYQATRALSSMSVNTQIHDILLNISFSNYTGWNQSISVFEVSAKTNDGTDLDVHKKLKVGGDIDYVIAGNDFEIDLSEATSDLRAGDRSTVYGGSQGDVLVVGSDSNVYTQDGDDRIVARPGSYVEAGNGDDFVRVFEAEDGYVGAADRQTRVDAGAGNDEIYVDELVGVEDVFITYNKGDGRDRIVAERNVTIEVGEGYSIKDAKISIDGPNQFIGDAFGTGAWVYFEGSDDGLRLDLEPGAVATLKFSDGELVIDGKAPQADQAGDDVEVSVNDATGFVRAGDRSEVLGRAVRDVIWVGDSSSVDAGGGNDQVYAGDYATIDLGAGRDKVQAGNHAHIVASSGNSAIGTGGFSTVMTGGGHDHVRAGDHADISSGSGEDVIVAGDAAVISAGEGDDGITVGSGSRVAGNAGDDKIRIGTSENVTIAFNKGDGNDQISASTDLTIEIGDGYSWEDATVTEENGRVVVSFEGSSDSLTLSMSSDAIATLKFSDGELFVNGQNQDLIF